MKKQLTVLLVLFAMSTLLFTKCRNKENESGKETAAATANFGGYDSQVKWGEHLITSGGCGDCHTPKKMTPMGPADDSSLLLSGQPSQMPLPDVNRLEMQSKGLVVSQTFTQWIGPWGISFAANLTSDSTGIGMWKEEQFIYALRNGITKGMAGSRPMLPPMPWPALRNRTDDELKAMFAYLKTIKPIKNVVPPPQPPVTK
ncbi:MAG: diheme cytochrome c-553 [Sphingobacteriales bacterium]